MSFQRMLMMAAREPQPYLPHPEDLICLYVPRWQTEQGNTLTDWSRNGRDMMLTNANYDSDGNFVNNNNSRGIWRGNAGTIRNYTIIANRRLREAHVGNQYGFLLSWLNNNATVVVEMRQSNIDKCKSLGVTTNIIYPNFDGWIFQRKDDYCGQPIGYGTQYRLDYGVSFSGASLRMAWLTVRSVAVWSISLTDKEIVMAQRYLDTASLEDYMMSRL